MQECPDFAPRYNIAPTSDVLVMRQRLKLDGSGRWCAWAPDGTDLVTTCIITTAANALMVPIHERMPVILDPGAWDGWLTPQNPSVEALKWLLGPCGAEGVVACPVGMAVNRAGVEGEGLIAPGF